MLKGSDPLDAVSTHSACLAGGVLFQIHLAALQVVLPVQQVGPPELLLELSKGQGFPCTMQACR